MNADSPADLALLLLRLGVGGVFITHGIGKLHRRPGLKATAWWFDSIGLRPGRLHAQLAAATELVVGALLVLGLLTAPACAGVIGLMGVAILTATGRKGFDVARGGWEYNGVLVVVAAALALIGPGGMSIDSALDIYTDGATGLAIALVLGVVGIAGLWFTQRRTAARTPAEASS